MIEKLEHIEIGKLLASDKNLVKKALAKCKIHSERVYLLRAICKMNNSDIADLLNLSVQTVEVTTSRLRRLGFAIPDKRKTRSADNIRERMKEILSSLVLENVNLS